MSLSNSKTQTPNDRVAFLFTDVLFIAKRTKKEGKRYEVENALYIKDIISVKALPVGTRPKYAK